MEDVLSLVCAAGVVVSFFGLSAVKRRLMNIRGNPKKTDKKN